MKGYSEGGVLSSAAPVTGWRLGAGGWGLEAARRGRRRPETRRAPAPSSSHEPASLTRRGEPPSGNIAPLVTPTEHRAVDAPDAPAPTPLVRPGTPRTTVQARLP